MIKCLVIVLLFASLLLCGELRFGPRLGVVFPSEIKGISTYPGSGLYWGAVAEFPLSSLFSVELGAGAALGMGKPPGDQLPGYPSYSNHDADYFATDLALSLKLAALRLAAGPGYYYFHMDWEQDLTGSNREFKTIDLSRIGCHFSAGIQLDSDINFDLVLLFPEFGNPWIMLRLTVLPFKVQVP